MKVIGQRILNEPAVAFGLLFSLALVIGNLLGDNVWDAEHIVACIAPLASSLGIRQLVTPTAKEPA